MADISPSWVAKKVEKLNELIADETELDDDESILDQVFDEDDLEQIAEEFPILHATLARTANDYDAALTADDNLEQSQMALTAIVDNMKLRANLDKDAGEDPDPEPGEKKTAERN